MTDSNLTITINSIENKIFILRGVQIMIDRDLAEIYQVQTKVLNQAVKRNMERFPKIFRFQLTNEEKEELVTNCDRFENLDVYHLGASIKDLGKKWFAFAKLDKTSVKIIDNIIEISKDDS